MSSTAVSIWSEYAKAWAPISDHERRKIIAQTLDPKIAYTAASMVCEGHEGVIQDIEGFQANFPGGHFFLYSKSVHHDVALIEWQLILSDGTESVLGHDAIHISAEGKIDSIATFAKATPEPKNA
jgi:hypothetical protein